MPRIFGGSKVGEGTYLGEDVIIGYPGKTERALLLENRMDDVSGAVVGKGCVIRDCTIIYNGVVLGDNVQTGHHTLVRERTEIGEGSVVGSGTVIEDGCRIGARVSIQSGVYIPSNTVIEDDVFIGPRACFTNDKYMGRCEVCLEGAHVESHARIGANATILPTLRIGRDSIVGAGAVVTADVKPYEIVAGVPARVIGHVPEEQRRA
jgi:acetyltransferase-like isoleucine patch superfamily enzyme